MTRGFDRMARPQYTVAQMVDKLLERAFFDSAVADRLERSELARNILAQTLEVNSRDAEHNKKRETALIEALQTIAADKPLTTVSPAMIARRALEQWGLDVPT